MIHLNFNNLDDKTQKQLFEMSKKDVERQFGEQIKAYAERNRLKYSEVLYAEVMRNLYSYRFTFRI
ncbi:hypothetical protein L0P88_17475 [Muricauda sp. SCSIO 64092]|uniref:hypothetical protein n=1 Tax=Allomuricauda sp. SCSIO 64092 TaxID=2908842 RepID=UPI001FF2FAC1|nr:hypothetical protein [Muricauda sp. SCSIO 64092]UOY05727.1 hypothetical protein L0P88_17475 [Muricauda sp. SCSIO 64092]